MKNNLTKIIFSLLLIFSMVLTLIGCGLLNYGENEIESNSEHDTEITKSSGEDIIDYKVIENNGEYRIIFDDMSKYSYVWVEGEFGDTATWIDFDNMNKMQEVILNGKLTDGDKHSMVETFEKDENSVIIPNIFSEVVHPLSYREKETVTLSKGQISYYLSFKEINNHRWDCSVITKKFYESKYNLYFENIENQEHFEVEYDVELSDGQIIKCYEFGLENTNNYIIRKYILSDSKKTVFVEKRYRNESDVPSTIQLFGVVDGKNYFYADSWEQYDYRNVDLTDEFLFGFDIEKIEK